MSKTYSAAAIFRDAKATLVTAATAQPNLMLSLCEVQNTKDQKSEKHEHLDDPGQLEVWTGERKYTQLLGGYKEVTNQVYDGGLLFSYDDYRYNRTGSFMRQVNKMGVKAGGLPEKLLAAKLIAGTTDLAYDGVAYFHDAHPVRRDEGGTQDNLLAGAGATRANIITDLTTKVIPYFAGVKDTAGEPFHNPNELQEISLVYPVALAGLFDEIINAAILGTDSNVLKARFKGIPQPRLSDANDWYSFVTGGASKPMIWQIDQPLRTDQSGNDYTLQNEKRALAFGASTCVGHDWLFWQSGCKVVNA